MTIPVPSRIPHAFRSTFAGHVAAWVAVAACALAGAAPAGAQEALSERATAKQGEVGVQLEKDAEWGVPLCPGGNVAYTVRIENIGTVPGSAEIVDPIPAGATFVAGSAAGDAFYDAANDRIVWEGLLAPGESHTIGFSVTVDQGVPNGTSIVNQATGRVIAGETVAETQVQVGSEVACPPLDLAVDKTAELAQPLQCPGGNVFFEIRFTNLTDRSTTLDAELEDPIPAGATFEGSLTGGAVYDPAGDRVTWQGTLGPGETHSVGFSVTIDETVGPGDAVTNTATVTLADPKVGDSTEAQASETVSCSRPPLDLTVTKTAHFAEPLACPGGNVFFEVRFTNRSARDSIQEALVEDPIPAGTTLIEESLSDGAELDSIRNRITWRGPLPPGETETVSFAVVVDESASPGQTIVNEATVTLSDAEAGDSVQERATASVSCPSAPIPIELVKLQLRGGPVCPGSTLDYDLILTNPEENERTLDGSIEDAIPADTSFVPGSILGGARFEEASNEIAWEGELAAGESKLVGFSVRVADGVANGTLISNTAEGELTDPETGASDRAQDEATDRVDCDDVVDELDIELEKTSVPDVPLCPESTIDYEIVLTNPASNGRPLLGRVVDVVPADTTFVGGGWSGPGFAFVFNGRLFWFGVLDPGQSVTLVLTVRVDEGVADGTVVFNRARASLLDPETEEVVHDKADVEDEVDCGDGGGCRIEVAGFAEDSIGNGQGAPYPVSNARVWLFDVEDDPFPVDPLSEQDYDALDSGRTNRTFESDFDGQEFPRPGRARFQLEATRLSPAECPPRTVVASALWDADDRFAVAPRNHVGGRYVPAYLARCISADPDEILPTGPCLAWQLQGARFVPWDPVKDERAEVRFAYGSSPTNAESTRVVHDPATADPPLSESWDLGGLVPPDSFFQDAAHMYFFSYKASEYLSAVAGEVRDALADIADPEDGEPEDLVLPPVLVTAHDRDCASGCAWPEPQLRDDPLRPLPGRLPLSFGGLEKGGPVVAAGTLVAFSPSHSSSRPFGAPAPATGDTPDNREWHELGHHWMIGLYGGDWPGAYRNDTADCEQKPPPMPPVPARFGNGKHCGYANQRTTDSYVEGFAELTSMLIADAYDDPKPFLYRFGGNDRNLEVDHQVWGPYLAVRGEGGIVTALQLLDPREEDFAVAGILWDLFDDDDFVEPKARGVLSDVIRLEDRSQHPAADLFARIRMDLPEHVADLHATLSAAFPANGDADPFNDVEEVFLAHGVFGDAERDLRQDAGEILGDTGSSVLPNRPVRLSREPLPNGFLDYGVVTDGLPVSPAGATLELRYAFDPPFDYYDYGTTVPATGRLHVHMPPAALPSRVEVVAVGEAGDLRSDPLVITSDEYWDAVAAGEPSVGKHTFVLGGEDPPAPPPGDWLAAAELAGFEAKVRITPRGGEPLPGGAEPACIVETLCVSGALVGRPEIFVKVIGPRPNGKLWTQISRFTPSQVEVWLRQVAGGTIRYYRLDAVGPASDDVSGLQDREAFDPAGAASTVPRGALLPGGAVELFREALPHPPEPGEPAPPESLDWLATPELPGFRFKALISPAGGQEIGGQRVDRCIPETLCIHGALAGRPEVFAKIIGPRPNGFLWVQAARFTPSQVELWVEQTATGTVRYYRLAAVGPRADDVSGLQDREAFPP